MTETELQDAILRHSLDLQRLAGHETAEAFKVLRQLETELRALLNSQTLSEANKRAINAIIAQADEAIAAHYGTVAGTVDLHGLMMVVADNTAALIGATAKPTAETLASLAKEVLIDGARTSAWWEKQSEDAQFKFAAAVRQGVVNGETNERIVARVAGKHGFLEVGRRNARALVHSSIMSAANDARLAVYKKMAPHAKGVRWLATLDSHTCMRCMALDGQAWDFDGKSLKGSTVKWQGTPPLHISCRCVISLIPKSLNEILGVEGVDELAESLSRRASKDGPVANTHFEDFLSRQSPAFIAEVLGKKRAAMFAKGGLTLHDLIDGATARPLTLAELAAKYPQ